MGHRGYYAIIPADVRYDEELPANAKLLYGEITALCNEKGYCWAGNSYFAELYKVTNRTVSSWIQILEEKGYIEREVIRNKETKQVEKRLIRLASGKKSHEGIEENFLPSGKNIHEGIEENFRKNNTSFNNTTNNTLEIPIVEIINYLNDVAGKNFRPTTKKTKNLIKARWNEGFRFEDFKTVIDNKVKDWKQDPHMNKYLRPETLFGTKFESYLNEQSSLKGYALNQKSIPKSYKDIDWEALANE